MKNKQKGLISIIVAGILGLIMLVGIGVAVKDENLNVGGTINPLPVRNFLGLTDTPNSYSGQANKVVSVNAGATALEFISAPDSMVYPGAGIALSTGSAWGTSITDNSANWNTAYGWGNHATAGYLSSLSGALLATGATTGATASAQPFTLGVKTGKVFPASDSTTALQFLKADGTTNILNIDTTNGRVGIGTTAPGSALEVSGATPRVLVTGTNNGGNAGYRLTAKASDGTVRNGGLYYVPGTTPATTYLGLAPDNVNSFLVVTSDGNVGIGTTVPDTALTVAAGTGVLNNVVTLSLAAAGGTTSGSGAGVTAIANSVTPGARKTSLYFSTYDQLAGGYTEKVRIQSDGNVGIGTTGPGAKLHVSGNVLLDNNNAYQIYNSDGPAVAVPVARVTGLDLIFGPLSGEGGNVQNSKYSVRATGLDHIFTAGASTLVTFKGSGNVGIGTTSPTAVLQIKAGTATAGTAPLKLTSGTLNTTPEAGAIEFLSDAYYGSITTGPARKQFAFIDGNVATATALAADPADCGAGTFADAINASGTLTCNAVVSADITDGTITLADTAITAGRSLTIATNDILADAELYTDTKCTRFSDPTAADDFKSIWFSKIASTITSIWAESDQTVTFMLQVDDGTPADVDSVDLAPAAGVAEDTSLNGDTTMAAGDRLDIDLVSVSGTPTWVSICWTLTYDD